MTQQELNRAVTAFLDIATAADLRQIELATTPAELNDAKAAALGKESPIKQFERELWNVRNNRNQNA